MLSTAIFVGPTPAPPALHPARIITRTIKTAGCMRSLDMERGIIIPPHVSDAPKTAIGFLALNMA
jgi:hypothetical protein